MVKSKQRKPRSKNKEKSPKKKDKVPDGLSGNDLKNSVMLIGGGFLLSVLDLLDIGLWIGLFMILGGVAILYKTVEVKK